MNKLIKNTSFYFIGELFLKGLTFITIPIFTRLLSPEDYGVLSIFTSLNSIFAILLSLNIGSSIVRRYYEKSDGIGSYIFSNYIFLFLYNIFIFIILLLSKNFIAESIKVNPDIIIFSFWCSFLAIYFSGYINLLNARNESKKYAILSVINRSSVVILSILLMFYLPNDKYYGRVYGQLIIAGIFLIVGFVYLYKEIKFKFDIKEVFYSVKFGVPLMPHMLSHIVMSHFDRIVIAQFYTMLETGLYSFAYNISTLMRVLIYASQKAWTPHFYKLLKEDNTSYNELNHLAKKYSIIVFSIGLFLVLFSKEIIYIVAPSKYSNSLDLLPILICAELFVFIYLFYVNYAYYFKKTFNISVATIVSAIINIVLNYIFVPRYGYKAAALTTMVTFILLLVFHYINSRYILKLKVIRLLTIIVEMLFGFSAYGLFYLYSYLFNYSDIFDLVIKVLIFVIFSLIQFFRVKKPRKSS